MHFFVKILLKFFIWNLCTYFQITRTICHALLSWKYGLLVQTLDSFRLQCFGGDQGEIWDQGRRSYRRGRRWWNAYLLFYENVEESINESLNDISQGLSDVSISSSNSESFCVPQVIMKYSVRNDESFLFSIIHWIHKT